jgi:hypothetical protein
MRIYPGLVVLLMLLGLLLGVGVPVVFMSPQPSAFIHQNGFWYDAWDYTRDYALGVAGFMPNLAYEVLGEWQDRAFDWGKEFIEFYPDTVTRAEAILSFVQQWTEYGYDEDNVQMGGSAQIEWAWNADDMATRINFDTSTVAIGDCEDLAFLCSAIYEGAGFDTAMVLTSDHAALLVWLPEYPNVIKWDLIDDGRDYGWIWVESTGENNPLGWTPDEYRDGDWEAFVVGSLYLSDIRHEPTHPSETTAVTITTNIFHIVSALDDVSLLYTQNGVTTTVKMMNVEESIFQATIPVYAQGTQVEYWIRAQDQSGNEKITDPFMYQVSEEDKGFQFPDIFSHSIEILVIIVALIIIFIIL